MKNNTVFKFLSIILVLTSLFIISSCKKSEESVSEVKSSDKIETVKVESGSITPTLSTKTTIKKAAPFIIESNNKGFFKSAVFEDQFVKRGQTIGWIDGTEIKAPVDSKVISVNSNIDVPKNYPLFEMQYNGFSIDIKAENFLNFVDDINNLKAKFQVQDGVGPQDILSVVLSSEDGFTLQCLIDTDIEARANQLATVVVTSNTKEGVMTLPVSVVSGRFKSGSVTKVENGKFINKDVVLGVTDGAYIEIVSGLSIDDEISVIPPNLDPRE